MKIMFVVLAFLACASCHGFDNPDSIEDVNSATDVGDRLAGVRHFEAQAEDADVESFLRYVSSHPYFMDRIEKNELGDVISLHLDEIKLEQEHLICIESFAHLRYLTLRNTHLNSESVLAMNRVRTLELLNISGCNLTVGALALLQENTSVKTLIVGKSNVTADLLFSLQVSGPVNHIVLDGCQLFDNKNNLVKFILSLESVDYLSLNNIGLSDEDVLLIHRQRPYMYIRYNQ